MNLNFDWIRGILIILMCTVIFGWFFWWRFKESTDRGAMVVRWLITVGLVYLIVGPCGRTITNNMRDGSPMAVAGFLGALVCGLILAIIWVPEIVGGVGRKFGSLYDGGSAEVDPTPFYSIAQAQRTQGHYHRAMAEVRKQLERFPTDFEGQMLLASLQAENLDDLPGAEVTIQRFLQQPNHSPVNISYSLNLLADWQLKYARDRDAAQRALEQIVALLPDTEMALQAAQRIGRLADMQTLLEPNERRRITVHKGVENLGLMMNSSGLRPDESDPEKLAAAYVQHLQAHPLDTHVRESLAVLYANHYQRLDLAADQIDQLVRVPNQPGKQIVRWLNLLADLQVQHGAPFEAVQETLQRIIDQFPDLAAANNTRRRLDTLRLEFKAKEQKQDVKLGTYEQNIGLKRGPAKPAWTE